ncbi:MAG: ABC transporter substrate-binding protein [Rothia sp. (in: high G+C Gram-positive bacteria)]|uniref:heme/hemin ABC transporter substrate-binding protein n=1 Tax=Rothia sp. (in: high G+C Gram-positive bacteria) TaxID=1885016 RepID=UPI0026DECAB3|nr:ABC transporter substrate-binding protein [Rothia sp. (in: high G+C Gram-positive bacteria)]MDO5750536.1 ABC transporter substrate-binding protein [Rothia sp. (in: high G+C Gram-positive bacteria)]
MANSSSAPRSFIKSALALLTALLMLVLTGCGVGTQNASGGNAATQQVVNEQESQSRLDSLISQLKGSTVDNPKSITGPSTAENAPEIQPMVDKPTPKFPVTLTDHQGTEVTIKSADRILALDMYGTIAQEVIALGLGDRLVGRVIANTEPSLQKLPLVTQNGHDLNAEAVLSTNPDLVLYDESNGPQEIVEQLRSAGITVVVLDKERSMQSIIPQLKAVAHTLGVDEAGEQVATRVERELQQAMDAIKEVAPKDEEGKIKMVFLYVRGNGGVFFILGDGSGADDLIDALQGVDVASRGGAKELLPANSESLVKVNPDMILTMTNGVKSTGNLDGFLARPGVMETNAGKNRRVVDMADGQILSYGPNTPAVLLQLARAIYAK